MTTDPASTTGSTSTSGPATAGPARSTGFTAPPGFATSTLCDPETLVAPDGARLTACAHGGHVLGWTPAGGRERLWLSPLAECGPGKAIRGGVPVVFPQFSDRGPLPKHGIARDRAWHTGSQTSADGGVEWTASLTDDDETRQIWPHGFELTLTAWAGGDRLEITLAVRNTGDTTWSFAAALHSYLALGEPTATIHGLGGHRGQDNAAAGRPVTLGVPGEVLVATLARDVAIPDAGEPLLLDDPVLGPLVITADGFPDRVLWNPGPEQHLADVPAGAEAGFVCLEPAALTPVELTPGALWTGRQSLRSGTL